MDIKERIMQYLDNKRISRTRAEEILGWGKGTLIKSKSISSDKTGEFLLLFTDLSAEWLLTGNGPMFKSDTNKNNTSPINVDGDLKTIEMKNKLKKTEALLDAMIEQNERLKTELAEYKAKEVLSKGIA